MSYPFSKKENWVNAADRALGVGLGCPRLDLATGGEPVCDSIVWSCGRIQLWLVRSN